MNKENEGNDVRLDAIVDYDMDSSEAKAYKLCLLWLDRSRKIFPDYNHAGMKQGDPRKSLLFKYCFKLVRESLGLLDEKDYPLYVRAQLDILRHINIGKNKPLISPACLAGEKAWKRWKLWRRKYETVTKKPTEVSQITLPGVAKALDGLEKTKEFINKTFGEKPSLQDYQEAYNAGNLFRWINFGKVSPYYLVLSPYIEKILKPEDFVKLNFDVNLYKPCITEQVSLKFKDIFGYEK